MIMGTLPSMANPTQRTEKTSVEETFDTPNAEVVSATETETVQKFDSSEEALQATVGKTTNVKVKNPSDLTPEAVQANATRPPAEEESK